MKDKVTTKKGGWAIKGSEYNDKQYIFLGNCYQSQKAARELLDEMGYSLSIKKINKLSFLNKNGKYMLAIATSEKRN